MLLSLTITSAHCRQTEVPVFSWPASMVGYCPLSAVWFGALVVSTRLGLVLTVPTGLLPSGSLGWL